jgi:hypothetical protein
MAATAAVLLVKQTGHVLATLTTVGNPASVPSAAAVAGAAFPVRNPADGQVVIEIAPDGLDTKLVPLVDDLLIQPQNCAADDQGASLLAVGVPVVAIASGGVTVTVAAAPTKTLKVWVQVDSGGGSSRRHEVFSGTIDSGKTDLPLPNTFASGHYDVLALVEGLRPLLAPNQPVP